MRLLSALLILQAVAVPAAGVSTPQLAAALTAQDSNLVEARKLLWANEEGDCQKGAQMCVAANSVESVESVALLLEVLATTTDRGLAAAHYRDVCWGALLQITDIYARRRVEQEMKENKESAWVRQWCAETLGLYGSADYGPALIKLLNDKEDDVRSAAARALGRIKYPGAQNELEKRTKAKDYILRANAIEALALIDPATNEKTY